MDLFLLGLIQREVIRSTSDDTVAARLEDIREAVQQIANLQSEPGETAPALIRCLDRLEDNSTWVQQIGIRVGAHQPLSVPEWHSLYLMVTFRVVWESGRTHAYPVIFDAYPELGSRCRALLSIAEGIDWKAVLDVLNERWDHEMNSPGFEYVALALTRSCGIVGTLGPERLYRRIGEYLKFRAEFLTVVVAAACFKVPDISRRVAIEEWTDSQYACMKLLDHFVEFGEAAWG